MQNFPNPFNPSTTIGYVVPTQSYVSIRLYDVLGREVGVLVDGLQSPGNYSVHLDASSLASGVYFYKLQANTFGQTRKLTVVK